jgi:1-acyl-sn-glycerol-3-phosphate acyltransferase
VLGVDLAVSGMARIDTGRSYVVVPLHEGVFDPLAILHLPLPLRFVLRSEIMTWRGVGRYARATGQIAADPEAGRTGYRSLLVGAGAAQAAGDSLVVFPQGTLLGIETAFSPGAFRVAERTGQPLLPVVLTGSHQVWEHPFTPRLRFGARVGMKVLAPIEPDEIRNRGSEVIRMELQNSMKSIALNGTMPPPRRFDPDRDGWWDDYAYEIDPAFPELAARIESHRKAARV